jgi:hypothetical protein
MSADDSEFRVDPAIAMVAVSSNKLPSAARIVSVCGINTSEKKGFLSSLFGKRTSSSKEFEWEDTNLVFPFKGSHVAVSFMPGPIPWTDLEGPCATSWWWPEATEIMKTHEYHFLVTIIGGSIGPVDRRVLLTKLVSEVIKGADAVGVYWGEGTLVHEPGAFIRQAKSVNAQEIPGPLWIDVRVAKNPDGTFRCFTTGLNPLGFLEVEVPSSTLAPEELMSFIGDTTCYIVNNRLQIPDGDTMGRTATEKYKVKYGPSMFDRPKVMHLIMV